MVASRKLEPKTQVGEMDLNGAVENGRSVENQQNDAENDEAILTSPEVVEGDAVEYVTVGPDHGEMTLNCDPSDPSIIYDADGQPINMDELNPGEKEIIIAVQDHLTGQIIEESGDEGVVLLPDEEIAYTSSASDSVHVVAIPNLRSEVVPMPEDVIATAMMEAGFDEQSQGDQDKTSLNGENVSYWVVPKSSARGRDKLYDSLGHSYTFKSKNATSVVWRCKVRTKKFHCKSKVIQRGDQFTSAGGEHNHDTKGNFIEIAETKPVRMVHSVEWDATPLSALKTQKKQLNAGERVIKIGLDGEETVTSTSPSMPTVVIVETPLPPRNKIKTSKACQVMKSPIKQEAIEEIDDDTILTSDSDESLDLQDTDDLISPLCRKMKQETEQKHVDAEEEEEECSDMEESDPKVAFRIIKGGSARRCDKLFDSRGYSYTVKRVNTDSVTWRCTLRQKHKLTCAATVKQYGKRFIESDIPHSHDPRLGDEVLTVLSRKVKQTVQTTPGKSIPDIAREHIGEMVKSGVPEAAIPSFGNLVRKGLHFKHKTLLRKNPKTIDFDLDRSLIPDGFIRDDLYIVDARHLIFATEQQLKLLKHSRLWFVDCAVCSENKPFYLLLTIHIFVRNHETVEQVPALFAFMSKKSLDDYVAVLQSVKFCLQDLLKLRRVVLQYESPMWNAFNLVFPDVKRSGCIHHFQQCVYDKMVKLGLKDSYDRDETVKMFVKQLMSLCMIPYIFFVSLFIPMERKAPTKELAELCSSFREMWLETSIWTLKSIVGFDTPVRTEADTLGWNASLNEMGWGAVSLYAMVHQLFNKFSSKCLECYTISEKKLILHQRKQGTDVQQKILKLWKNYQNGSKSPKGLLKSIAHYSVL